jgi:hypothetical protein
MPSKSMTVSRIRTDVETGDEKIERQASKLQKKNWFLIIIYAVLALFFLNVVGECIYNSWNKSLTDEKEENICLSYFIKEKCDLGSLNERCNELMTCFKGDKVTKLHEIANYFDMFVDEVLENVPIPGIFVVILTVVKYFKKDDAEMKED